MAKKILLADDSITIQKVISLTLSGGDYDLTVVGDGDSAIQKAAEIAPQIVLADVAMPGKTGYQVCEAIKASSGVPVLLLSGTFDPLNEAEAQRVGADDHIVKPFESEALIEKIEALLASGAVAPTPVAPQAPAPVAPTPAAPAAPVAAAPVVPTPVVPQAPAPVAPTPAAPAAPPVAAQPVAAPEPGLGATDEAWSAQDFSATPAAPAPEQEIIEEAMELTEGDLIETSEEEAAAVPPPEALDFGTAPEPEMVAPPTPVEIPTTAPATELGGGLDFSGFEEEVPPTEVPVEEVSVSEPTLLEEAGGLDFTDMAPEPEAAPAAPAPVADAMDFSDIDTEDPLAGGVEQAPTPIAHPEEDFLADTTVEAAAPAVAPVPAAAPVAAPVAPAPVAPAPVAAPAESFTEKVMAQAALEGITDIGAVDKAQVENLINKVAREVIEEVAWEVIPEMAEDLIKKQIIDKVKKAMSEA